MKRIGRSLNDTKDVYKITATRAALDLFLVDYMSTFVEVWIEALKIRMGSPYDKVTLDIVSARCLLWYRFFREHPNAHCTVCDWFSVLIKSGIRSALSESSTLTAEDTVFFKDQYSYTLNLTLVRTFAGLKQCPLPSSSSKSSLTSTNLYSSFAFADPSDHRLRQNFLRGASNIQAFTVTIILFANVRPSLANYLQLTSS